jgi:hypothetical protein
VQGPNLYAAADPWRLTLLDRAGSSVGSARFSRCQRVAVDAERQWIVAGSHGDEVQPSPFLSVFDAGDLRRLEEVAMPIRSESVEGMAVSGDLLVAAAHEWGLLSFRFVGTEEPELVASIPLAIARHVEVDGDLAHVANGAAGLAVVVVPTRTTPDRNGGLQSIGRPRVLRGP